VEASDSPTPERLTSSGGAQLSASQNFERTTLVFEKNDSATTLRAEFLS
jgi:hypothetical protein